MHSGWCAGETTKLSEGSISNFSWLTLEYYGKIRYLANFKTTSEIRYFTNLSLANLNLANLNISRHNKALSKALTGTSSLVYNIFIKEEVRKRKRERKRQKGEE